MKKRQSIFGVSTRSLFRWQRRIEPNLKRSKPPTKIDEERLRRHVEEHPDAYLREWAELFGVNESAIRKAFKRMGITRKKTLEHPKADPQAKAVFRQKITDYAKDNLGVRDKMGDKKRCSPYAARL